MLRREARLPRKRATPLALAAGMASLAGAITMYIAGSLPDVVVVDHAVLVPTPVIAPRLMVLRVPAIPPPPVRVDGRIEHVAASANADVIAFATKDRVWISRDGGASFAPALEGKDEIGELFVDLVGNVYAKRPDALGVESPEHHTRWVTLPALDGRVMDAEDGELLAEQWNGGAVETGTGGGSWRTLIGGREWNVLAAKAIAPGAARLIMSERLGEHHWSAPALHLVGARGDRVVWRGAYDDSVGFLRSSTPCAALVANDGMWIVQRDSNPDLDKPTAPAQLLEVDNQGKASRVPIALNLDADRVTCSIVGNDHQVYASFSIDGGAPRLYGLSSLSRDATYLPGDPLDLRAVDNSGRALGLADGNLVRRRGDGTFEILARGR